MAKKKRSIRELRAFDWVDYVLYLLATAGFVWPTLSLLSTGEFPAHLISDREAGLLPTLGGEADQKWYQTTAGAFGLFVVLVYLRNYIMMHRIDDRRDGAHYEFFFVDYNLNGWSRSERIVRALIVLWVLTTTIGAVPPVTAIVHGLISEIVTHTIGLPSYQNLSITQGFFTYYGLVVLVLFCLFILWDSINIWSIGRQVKAKRFDGRSLGPPAAFNMARARNFEAAFPETLANAVPVYSLVTYIRPRGRTFGSTSTDCDSEPFDCWSNVRSNIEQGKLFRLYFKASNKFVERFVGILIGGLLFLTPFLSDASVFQMIVVLMAFGTYLAVLNIELWFTLTNATRLFFDYFFFASRSWEPEPSTPAPVAPPPEIDEEKAP